jgi:hypothetical protein
VFLFFPRGMYFPKSNERIRSQMIGYIEFGILFFFVFRAHCERARISSEKICSCTTTANNDHERHSTLYILFDCFKLIFLSTICFYLKKVIILVSNPNYADIYLRRIYLDVFYKTNRVGFAERTNVNFPRLSNTVRLILLSVYYIFLSTSCFVCFSLQFFCPHTYTDNIC